MCAKAKLLIAALGALATVIGCHASHQGPLPEMIGHRVHLTGQFNGPGKIADFILLPNGAHVYLTGKPDTANVRIEYGTPVTVDGILHHFVAPERAESDTNDASYAAGIPEYYFIEDAIVRPAH